MDGKTIRLRASCNACNESKVRCSQRKPTCARCERNGTECIYGRSRRTHKDAPPIAMPPSHRPRGSPQVPPSAHPIHHPGLLLDSGSLVTESGGPLIDAPSTVVTRSPTPGTNHSNPWALGSLFSGNNDSDTATATATATDMATFWVSQVAAAGQTSGPPLPSCGECTCHEGVTELLASMRRGSDDRRLSLDAQLAKLKRCIASSETSMACCHGREDAEPIHIMAVATLISYIIDDFEMLASEFSLRRSSPEAAAAAAAAAAGEMAALGSTERESSLSSGLDESMSSMLEPRLSWGVLELEDDDEADLRQRLYLLSFRKLERLLSQLKLYLRNLDDTRAILPDASRQMGFVMACDYTRLWLEKKAEDVKRLFLVPT